LSGQAATRARETNEVHNPPGRGCNCFQRDAQNVASVDVLLGSKGEQLARAGGEEGRRLTMGAWGVEGPFYVEMVCLSNRTSFSGTPARMLGCCSEFQVVSFSVASCRHK
jgi:hypothetical protein